MKMMELYRGFFYLFGEGVIFCFFCFQSETYESVCILSLNKIYPYKGFVFVRVYFDMDMIEGIEDFLYFLLKY